MRRRLLVSSGCIVLVVGAFALWAASSTDTSQLARAVMWGDSSYGDQNRFPSRPIEASTIPLRFEPTDSVDISQFTVADDGLIPLLENSDTTAFVVLHDDELLFEGYFNGSDRTTTQTSFSVAKSFVATLIGIAIDQGHLDGLDEPVTELLPELTERDPAMRNITLRHLITMSSGLSFDDGWSPWADPANTYYGTDLRGAALSTPSVERPPGEVFHYNDWNVILLGLVLERATGMSVTEFTEENLWIPMGAEFDGSWSLDSRAGGFEKMFVGVNGAAIDMAKLGWLYLHEGANGDRQVVSPEFVDEATRRDAVGDPASNYQYLWWVDEVNDAYFANGDHGQYVYVDPGAEVVIVRQGRSGDLAWLDVFADLVDWLEPQLDA